MTRARRTCRDKFPRFSVFLLAALFLCMGAMQPTARAGPPASSTTPIIVDTDVGTDDLLALAFLLARKDVNIEAITVVNGVAHVPAGAANVLALLLLAGRSDIPVYAGLRDPLAGNVAFPDVWRTPSEQLPGVDLPKSQAKPQRENAVSFLVRRLSDVTRPVRILALGPLTNLGAALRKNPSGARTIQQIVIMGGAIRVPGNLGDGGAYKTQNKTAEWNIFVDPLAASIVFNSGAPIRLIPLDATQQVPIHMDFVSALAGGANGTLEKFAAQVLMTEAPLIVEGYFYAWDPFAAVALVQPDVVSFTSLAIRIDMAGNDRGRTVESRGGSPNARVALTANADEFRTDFLAALIAVSAQAPQTPGLKEPEQESPPNKFRPHNPAPNGPPPTAAATPPNN